MVKRRLTSKEHLEWRQKILERDNYKCVICSKGPKYLNAHHLLPSEFHKYEHDVDNGITLCPQHHTLGKESAHKNPYWFFLWMKENRSQQHEVAIWRLTNEV